MGSERVTFKTEDGVALKGGFFRADSSSAFDMTGHMANASATSTSRPVDDVRHG